MKRDLGKKDAAALLPGFGGLIDLTDSIVYAGPLASLLWLTLPLANWTGALVRLSMAVPSPFHWL
jgi:phosphatidate cytidylyltransferase